MSLSSNSKVLYILPSFNIYGGTPKKTLDLMFYFGKNSVLYVYSNDHIEFKDKFVFTGGKVFYGFFGKNFFSHLKRLLHIVDDENIKIVQTQFFFGELLAYLLKLFRPNIIVVCAFVGITKLNRFKFLLSYLFYYNFDHFVFISKFVKKVKEREFKIILKKNSSIIYNGSNIFNSDGDLGKKLNKFSVLAVSGLIEIKNIQILIKAFNLIVNKYQRNDLFLYIAGDGPYRRNLEELIIESKIENNVFILGYQDHIDKLLIDCDIFVHPCYEEGFGIAVLEAMHYEKPILVSNSGSLPELIEHNHSGLVLDPYDPVIWANSILELINNRDFSIILGKNALVRANDLFSFNKFVKSYEELYLRLLNN